MFFSFHAIMQLFLIPDPFTLAPGVRVFFAFYLPHYGTGAYNVFQYIGKLILSDIAAPIRVVKDLFSKNENGKKSFVQIFRFITMLTFIAINAIAVIKTI